MFWIAMEEDNKKKNEVLPSLTLDFHFRYTVQKEYFMQSEKETDDLKFDFVCPLIIGICRI